MGVLWSEKLKTGIPVIDEQHQFIVEALSNIVPSELTKNELMQLVLDLRAYLSVHFTVEEDYMKDADYPEYAPHKENHDKVLEDCKDIFLKNSARNTNEAAIEFVNYMEGWFIEHYANEDVKMVAFLKKNLWKIS